MVPLRFVSHRCESASPYAAVVPEYLEVGSMIARKNGSDLVAATYAERPPLTPRAAVWTLSV